MMNATTQSRSSCPIWESRPESGPWLQTIRSRALLIEGGSMSLKLIAHLISTRILELFKLPWAGATNIQQQLGAAAADRLQIAQVQVAAPLQPLRPLRPQASIAPPTKTKTTTKTKTKTKKIRAR
nr:uncharacterized protein LOC108016569 [Drosophila suzukii]